MLDSLIDHHGAPEMRPHKVCPDCGRNRDAVLFRTYQGLCELCRTERHEASRIVSFTKSRAIKKGIPFDLTVEWVRERLRVGRCEVTGVYFDRSDDGHFYRRPQCPSLDRKDPELGYTQLNCRMVTWIYNRSKSIGTDEDVLAMAEALVSRVSRETRTDGSSTA